MRKFSWMVPVVLLAFGSTAFAQDADKPKAEKVVKEKAKKAAPAKLVADPAEVDLGDVKGGETKDVTFKIKNEGEAEAKNVACTATGFKFDGGKKTIAGGAAEEFKGTYAAPKKVGKKDKPLKGSITCGKAKVAFKGMLKAEEAAPKAAPEKAEKK
jgi:hypothetical protein